MKLIFTLLLTGIFSLSLAQQINVDIVDFYKWTSQEGINYEVMIVTEDFDDTGYADGMIRVRYSMNGAYKVVQYKCLLTGEIDEDGYWLVTIMANDDNFEFIQGEGGYSPDNFVLYFDQDGFFIFGSQADNNELNKPEGEELVVADIEAVEYGTKDEMKTLIKKFYSNNDPLYDDLLMYIGKAFEE